MVDSIDGNTYVFEPQQGGDENNLARGAWDWNFDWKRIPLNAREKVFFFEIAKLQSNRVSFSFRSKFCKDGLLKI